MRTSAETATGSQAVPVLGTAHSVYGTRRLGIARRVSMPDAS